MTLDLSLVGKSSPATTVEYGWKDVVLYALGVGAKVEELDYLYEGRGPKVIPTFPVVLTFPAMLELLSRTGGNLAMVVHGGQRVTTHEPIAPSGKLVMVTTLSAIYDLKRFAQVIVDTVATDEAGRKVAETRASVVFRGEGGFGGEPPPKEPAFAERPRDIPPTFRVEESTAREQALLYRLSGDHNPLHADPEFAAKVGFERAPILHGLCTYGYMVRHVARGAAAGDATRVRAVEAQFRRPVWPGETLVTEGWQVAPDAVALQVKVKERDEVVVAGAWAKLAP